MSVGFVVRWGRNGRISAENFFFEACGDMVKVRENIPEMETFNREETAQGEFVCLGNLYGDGMVLFQEYFIPLQARVFYTILRKNKIPWGNLFGGFTRQMQRKHGSLSYLPGVVAVREDCLDFTVPFFNSFIKGAITKYGFIVVVFNQGQ